MARHYFGQATAAVFAPLEPLSRPEQVSRRLADAIGLELLPDGAQLPGEIELAATFGVATVTVREALAILRRQELIWTRRGRGGGSFVRTPAGGAGVAAARLAQHSIAELRDLGDLYAITSGGAAALAASRASEDDVQALSRALTQLAEAADAGARRRADARFRVLTAVAAQSPRLYRAEVDLQAEIGMMLWLVLDDDSRAEELAQVSAILAAIESRAPDAARSAAEQRVRGATTRLLDHRLLQEDR